ncbi:uncharacterized protein L201_004761 [Kwoniella dendrophila CBS 6074]|uniref:Septin-type G domain-containing protein n=1 Tax=Kwoniella dendrophila CBS 6074 TaxID=1295534 RepID=A0AAX4JZA0_9TREE
MAPSFLRKRERPQSSSPNDGDGTSKTIRPSLSLPDLTTPLLDISSFEEVPPFKFAPKQPQHSNPSALSPVSPTSPIMTTEGKRMSSYSYTGANGRKPSLMRNSHRNYDHDDGKEELTQFHRPFTPKMINNALPPSSSNDFRQSKIGWSSDHPFSQPFISSPQLQPQGLPPTSWNSQRPTSAISGQTNGAHNCSSIHRVISRRKGKKKGTTGKLNIVVVGGKDVGKTSFINLLLSSLNSTEHPTPIIPLHSTTRPKSYTAISTSEDERERLLVRLIDTPGLDLNIEDELSKKSRERGLIGLLRLLEDRFQVMCEEEKKIRRMTGGEDGLIHLVIYLMDAREILHPQKSKDLKVDWSCIGLFDDDQPTTQDQINKKNRNVNGEAKVSEVEVDIIRELSKRSNVLPILTNSDLLTISELNKVKEAVRRDLGKKEYELPGNGFGIFNEQDEEEEEEEEEENSSSDDERENRNSTQQRPPTPESISNSKSDFSVESELPYSIILPDHTISCLPTQNPGEVEKKRTYKWGEISIFDSKYSDFNLLKETILGNENPMLLRNHTRQVLYETYRTERLLMAAKRSLRSLNEP